MYRVIWITAHTMNGDGHREETATSIIAISKLLSAKRINYYGWGDGSGGAPFQRVPSPNPLPLISLQSSSLSIIIIISVLWHARTGQRVEKESKMLNWKPVRDMKKPLARARGLWDGTDLLSLDPWQCETETTTTFIHSVVAGGYEWEVRRMMNWIIIISEIQFAGPLVLVMSAISQRVLVSRRLYSMWYPNNAIHNNCVNVTWEWFRS